MSAQRTQDGHGRWLAIVASGVVVATVVAAIFVMGSPSQQRDAKLDGRRVHDLNRIVQVVDHYVETHDALPPDLATLAEQPGQRLAIADPVTGARYGYEVTGQRSYRLCAVFVTDTAQTPTTGRSWTLDDWDHAVERQCFAREVDQTSDRE